MNGRKDLSAVSQGTVESIVEMPLTELYPFPGSPFIVRDDEAMRETAKSVMELGVLVPAIVRPREGGGFEIIAGHRRKQACELAGMKTMPVIIRDLDLDSATIMLVDSNVQREQILPSERAKAYKMRLEAMKRQAELGNATAPNHSAHFRSDDAVGKAGGISGDTVRNYISLNNLVPELMQMVDERKISLTPAYQIASLTEQEQHLLLDTMESEQTTPSVSQAQRMKKLSQSRNLNEDTMLDIMMEQKKPEGYSITLSGDKVRRYFPKSYTPAQMEEIIYRLLEHWQQNTRKSKMK